MKVTLTRLVFAPALAIQVLASTPKEGIEKPSGFQVPISATLTDQEKEAPLQSFGFRRWIFSFGKSGFLRAMSNTSEDTLENGAGRSRHENFFCRWQKRRPGSSILRSAFRIPEANQIMAELLGTSRYRQPIQGQRLTSRRHVLNRCSRQMDKYESKTGR